MGVRRASLSLLVLVPLLACSDPHAVGTCGDARSLDPSLRIPPAGGGQTVDDQWAEIARQVPGGWGGFLLVSGQPTIYLVHPEQRAQAVAALYASGVGQPEFDVRSSAVLRGRWDFAQLYDWYRFINAHVSTVTGLYSTDIDEAQNRLRYGVDPGALSRFRGALQALDLPCDLVILEATAPEIPL